jgi:glycosyltransferase involved in cell wall biosynthesis
MQISKPKISICIPTYNREKYLDWQLNQFLNFKDKINDWEFVISSNGSTDNTKSVVEKYKNKLRIIFHEFSDNLGPEINWQKTISIASSEIVTRISDDDFIDIDAVNSYMTLFIENPNLSCVYAPWKYLDVVNEKFSSQFYYQSDDQIIYKNDYLSTIQIILENRIFPEIFIAKKHVVMNFFKCFNNLKNKDIAFEFFELCAHLLKFGPVIFAKTPFYYSITNHPADIEPRIQVGNEIIKTKWDSYRGGFEILLGLARLHQNIPHESVIKLHGLLIDFIVDRMILALKFNFLSRNFNDCYLIYLRICALVGRFEIDSEINLDNILGLACIELIINSAGFKNTKFFLDLEINPNLRALAYKLMPEQLTKDEVDARKIYITSSKKSTLMSFNEAKEMIRLN